MDEALDVEINFNPNAVIVPLHSILESSSKNVLFGLRLLESVDQPIDFLEIKSENTFFSFLIGGPESAEDLELRKAQFKYWIIQKGIEDLIKGLNLSLIEAYLFLKFPPKIKHLTTAEDFFEEERKVRKVASDMNFPDLLARVNETLTSHLTHLEEIQSINKARNCLIHRNGLITKKDVNDENKENLIMKLYNLKMYYKDNDTEFEIQRGSFVPKGNGLQIRNVSESISFGLDEKIHFNYEQFNSLITTSWFFGQDLVQKLPTNFDV